MNSEISSAFSNFSDQLLGYLYRLTANKQDAEDILHDTFIRASEKYHLFKGESSLKTWVFSIATNIARDQQRVKRRWEEDAQDTCRKAAESDPKNLEKIFGSFRSQTEQKFELEEHINYCFTCIAKNLSLEKQIAIILKEIYEFKRNEIAEILNLSEGVIKHLLFEGRKELQEKYQHRCAIINKQGMCYQCAELNDTLQGYSDAEIKLNALGMNPDNSPEKNLDLRMNIIRSIHPLNGNGAKVEETIMQILWESLGENDNHKS